MRGAPLALAALAACSAKKAEPPRDARPPVATAPAAVAPDAAEPLPNLPAPAPVPTPPAALPAPAGEPGTAEAVALGELLFFDPRLSGRGDLACASCHQPEHGWATGDRRSTTAAGKANLRHTPSLFDLAWKREYGWDGRYGSLADVVAAHWKGQLDGDAATIAPRLARVPVYRAHFWRVAGGAPGAETAVVALAAFVRTRYSGDVPWDRAERAAAAGPRGADEVARGYTVFTGAARCAACHVPPLYTDLAYHRLGLVASADEGRGRVDPAATGAFATPTLRGAALHPPYFHDGSAATLEAAIDWHLAGGVGQGADRSIIDPALVPVTLTAEERRALIAFVRALSAAPAPYPRPPRPEGP